MIRTYLLNINDLENIKYDESWFGQGRREKIERFKHDKDKKLSAAAELLLIYAVKSLDPYVTLPLEIRVDDKGKPFLETRLGVGSASSEKKADSAADAYVTGSDGEPDSKASGSSDAESDSVHGPVIADRQVQEIAEKLKKMGFKKGELYFSISHSNEFAACAISNEPVGVDIEWIKRTELQHPEKILHKEEAETLSFITNPLEKKKYFFECWTLKESYLKNLGIGLIVRSGDFMISEDRLDASNKKLKPRYAHCCTPGEVINTDWKFDANYKVSWCTMKKDPDHRTAVLTAEDICKVI